MMHKAEMHAKWIRQVTGPTSSSACYESEAKLHNL